jgi:hypothetical protein
MDGHACEIVADSGPRQRRVDDAATPAAHLVKCVNSLMSNGTGVMSLVLAAAFITSAEVCPVTTI